MSTYTYWNTTNISDKEPGVIFIDDNDHPSIRAESALRCFPPYDACKHYNIDSKYPFLYWTIRDYAHAYRSGITTPSIVSRLLNLYNFLKSC